jgi:hypothetical protein
MAATTTAPRPAQVEIPTIPLRQIVPYAIFGGIVFLLALYFVGAEQGAASLVGGHWIHEFAHDGRHLLGFPCH